MILLVFLMLAIGAAAGFLAGLLGVGGGVVLVPGLYFAMTSLGYDSESIMHVAVGTSLAVIIPTGLSSVRAHWKREAVDMTLVRQIGIGIIFGVVIGTFIANVISGTSLKGIFGCALLVMSGFMLINPARFTFAKAIPPQPWTALAGSIIGAVSSLIGIGGATLSVPFMSVCKVPMHRAVGTASALGLIIAIPATIGFMLIGLGVDGRPPYSLGYINLLAWAIIVPISVMVAPLGAAAAHKLPVARLRIGFAIFILIVAVKMLVDTLG